MNVATEITEARVILEKGVRFEIPAPFLIRLFGKKTIVLTLFDPNAATYLSMVAMRLEMGVTDEEFEEMTIEQGLAFQCKNGLKIARIVAVGILRETGPEKSKSWISEKWLAKQLLKNYPMSTLTDIMHILTLGGGLGDFINTMGLLKTVRLTRPNNPSQRAKRS